MAALPHRDFGAAHPRSHTPTKRRARRSAAFVCVRTKKNGPVRFGRPLRSSNHGYGAWEPPAKRATPAHINVLLRQRERSEAYVGIERIPGKRVNLGGRALITQYGRGDVILMMDTQAGHVAGRRAWLASRTEVS